jgi:DNA-binding SARP family transcriptional activator
MTGRGGRLAVALRGAAALLTLIAAVIGLPLVLYRFGGDPVPRHLPSWHQLSDDLLHRDNGTIFLGAVRDVSWLAWAAFTVAVVAEVQAGLRGRKAPRLPLGGLQSSAGWLVAVAALAFSSQSAATLLAVPAAAAATVVATAPQQPPPPAAQPSTATVPTEPQVTNTAFYQLVTVQPGDCLWTIAHRYLGAGDRYPEIVKLNLGHEVGHGEVLTDPSVIWPGWVLQLPAGGAPDSSAAAARPSGSHEAHRRSDQHFGHPHHGAGSAAATRTRAPAAAASAQPAAPAASAAAATGSTTSGSGTFPGPAAAASSGSGSGAAQLPDAAHTVAAAGWLSEPAEIPPLAVFAAGMLAGGAGMLLAGMRHRQRQARRPGRRIAIPASAPVIVAEQRLRSATTPQPASALRAALSDLGVGLLESGRQLPDLAGIRLLPSGLEVLLASPASDPPPPPFTVPGGRQGMAWQLSLPDHVPAFPFRPAEVGDLMPGLFTIGLDDEGGYLLLDTEYLRVTTAEGPVGLVDQVLTTAGAELATSQLAGWYDLILVGFAELEAVAGRTTSCDSLEEALDLLAAKAVVLRRRLGAVEHADIRHRRLTQPGDEDWALTLLVSRVAPTTGQLALLLDLTSDPGGIAALVAGGADLSGGHPPPSSLLLAEDPAQPGEMVAHISPLGLRAWPQPLTDADYQALATLFTTAAELRDVAADQPPYDGSAWPPSPGNGLLPEELPSWLDAQDDPGDPAEQAELPGPGAEAGPAGAADPAGELTWPGIPAGEVTPAGTPAGRSGFGEPDGPPHPAGAPEPAGATLRVGVLGTFTVNGSPAALLPAQSQLVLALALNGPSGLSNQQLCYLLGADPDHPKPTDSLRQLIVRTRRQLGRAPDGREWIEHLGAGQYALHPDARFDWAEFEVRSEQGLRTHDVLSLRDALALIRGQPFTGCYHWWLDLAFAETVRAQIVDAAEMLAGLELTAGDPAASARAARTGLAGDATAEQLWRALMRAEYAAGNLSGVREAWSRCLDAIADIAPDGEPHPETAALYHQLISGKQAHPARTPG